MNVRTLCLGILWFREATGYEIKKLASEGDFSHFIEASYGSIYPALGKLTEDGLVTWRQESQAGKPARKVYSITEKGRHALVESLHQTSAPNDIFKSEFLFICLYAALVNRRHLTGVIDARIAEIEADLARLGEAHDACDHAGGRFAIGYGMALDRAALDYVKANRHLIEDGAGAESAEAAE